MASTTESLTAVTSVLYNSLMNAISSIQVANVQEIVSKDPSLVNMFGWHRQTALHRACLIGQLEIVQLLLDAGGDPNARNNFDETPVHYACKRGLTPVLLAILDKGGDITLIDKMGKGVLHHAAEAGSVPVLHLLQEMYPELHFICQDQNLQTPLHLGIKAGKLDVFKYLIKKSRSDLKCPDRDGNWPIHLSAQEGYGHMTWTQMCIMGLYALHVANKHGRTPYQLANMYDTSRHKELISELAWQRRQCDKSNVQQPATILWYFYLLLPTVLYGAAIILTRFMPEHHGLVFFPAVAIIVFYVKRSFHRLDHVSRWPQPIYAGAFAAGLFHTVLVYTVVILPYMAQYTVLKLLSFFLAVVSVTLYIKLLTRDPGVLTNSAQDEVTGRTLTILDVSTTNQWASFCCDCEMVQPRFTKHCKLCERCMQGMDHHCLFLLRCVAMGNHQLFVWFIIVCLICMAFFLSYAFFYVSIVYPSLSWWQTLMQMLATDSWVLSLCLLNCGSMVWGWSLLMVQYYMISNGYTTYYQPRKYQGNKLSTYQKLTNAAYFLVGNKPRQLNSSLSASTEPEVI